jgi:hypothetical protein
MGVFKNKSTRVLIGIMGALVVLAIITAKIYYQYENDSVDPRVKPARKLYEKYNAYAQQNAFDSVYYLMETIKNIYQQFPHYRNSYEVGVLYNNLSASFLTQALYHNDSIEKEKNILNAEVSVRKSILIYENWKNKYNGLRGDPLHASIEEDFYEGLQETDAQLKTRYVNKRMKEMAEAQEEIDRRLSVAYTNLGLIHRHREHYDSAAVQYLKAIELWDRNLTAENNLNILMGKPLRKRNLIQKMFPPKRD